MPDVTLGVPPFFTVKLSDEEFKRLKARFSTNPLHKGPCMIINRAKGLALDAGPTAEAGAHNVLWQPHGAPWQQWRLQNAGGGAIKIVSESSKLALTTMSAGFEWGESWLHNRPEADQSQRWRISETDDRAAFLIQNSDSGFALDAGSTAENLDPHMWKADWNANQQWMILRLPFT